MTAKFLKAKHWQLFLLTFGIPLVFQLIMFGEIGIKKTPTDIPFFPLWMYFFIGILYGWFWSIATEFQSNIKLYFIDNMGKKTELKVTNFSSNEIQTNIGNNKKGIYYLQLIINEKLINTFKVIVTD